MITPKITIITVVKNSKDLIKETIVSVIEQDFDEYEYVIIDGGSTDGTLEIINYFKDKIHIVVSESDKGIYDAMNKGISFSSGEFIYFLNSGDTLYDKNVLRNFFELIKNRKADVLIGKVNYLNNNSLNIQSFQINENILYKPICHQSIVAKRTLFDKYGFFDTKFKIKADQEWLHRIKNEKVVFINLDLIVANFLLGGISSSGSPLVAKETYIIGKKYYKNYSDLFMIYLHYYLYRSLRFFGVVKLKRWLWKKFNWK